MRYVTAIVLLVLGVAACASDGDRLLQPVQVEVSTRGLEGVSNACYAVRVLADGVQVSSAGYACSDSLGASGSISWVGVCDPSADPNVIEVALLELYDETGLPIDTAEWRLPCTAGAPCTRAFQCLENGDAHVVFDLTAMGPLERGFADVAVNLQDIRCAARAACEVGGEPIKLPYAGLEGERSSLLLEVECTTSAGQDLPTLAWSDFVFDCGGSPIAYPGWIAQQIPPSEGPVDAIALNAGYSSEPSTSLLVGLRARFALDRNRSEGCRVLAVATAWPGPVPPSGIPGGTRWPVIEFEVPLAGSAEPLACSHDELGGPMEYVRSRFVDGPFGFSSWFDGIGITQLVPSGT